MGRAHDARPGFTPARSVLLLLLSLLALAPGRQSLAAVLTGEFNWMHDPSRVIKCNGKYYIYCSGNNILMKYSTDFINWKSGKSVLAGVPNWARKAVPAANSNHVWAPDVIFLNNKYYLFWSFSTFGSKVSVIGLATSPTLAPESPNYKWSDQGVVLASNNGSDFNAIDPAPLLGARRSLAEPRLVEQGRHQTGETG
jgi:arabinan endo-1,5-alpha-L-arabinosidase